MSQQQVLPPTSACSCSPAARRTVLKKATKNKKPQKSSVSTHQRQQPLAAGHVLNSLLKAALAHQAGKGEAQAVEQGGGALPLLRQRGRVLGVRLRAGRGRAGQGGERLGWASYLILCYFDSFSLGGRKKHFTKQNTLFLRAPRGQRCAGPR